MYKIYYLTSILDCLQPKYIGYTSKNINNRLYQHIKDAEYGIKSHKANWIRKVRKYKSNVIIIEIDNVETTKEACHLERQYIESFDKWYNLTNSTNGGEKSKAVKKDVRNKISKSLKKYYSENEQWNKGKRYKVSEESKIKRRETLGDKLMGENNHFYGKHHKLSTRKKLAKIHRKYDYDYQMIYEFYIVKNMDRREISKETNLPITLIGKKIYKYGLKEIKKKVYGKIRGPKIIIDDQELLYRYYDYNMV